MRKRVILLLSFFLGLFAPKVQAQEWSSPEIEQMYNLGLSSMSKGNATEAIAIFQKIIPLEPNQASLKKSLAQAYQLAGNYQNVLTILEPQITLGQADAESYRLVGQAYGSLKEEKKAQKILADGIGKYPKSGLLYYEQGMMFKKQKNYENALKSWLDGIAVDPNFHLNYHEAAIAYVQTDQVIWAIIYAEIFINKEPHTQRAQETRILLLDAYHKLFFTPSKSINGDLNLWKAEPNIFTDAVKKTYLSLFFVVSDGINTENLLMLRSRFMVSWSNNYAQRFPFNLFSYHDDLMRNGHFDAYHQWLFGKSENPELYQKWTSSFGDALSQWEQYRKKYPLLLTEKDAYNKQRNFKDLFPESLLKAGKR